MDGEVVSFSNTLSFINIKKDVVETPIVKEPKKIEKVEESVEETTE